MAQIAVVAGETSGDIHAGNLIASIKSLAPGTSFWGIGGERMENAGAEVILDYSKISAMGLVEALSKLPELRRARALMVKKFRESPPDLLIPVDFGGFNLPLAKAAHEMGIPVIYFIPPKAWAWKESRVKKIKKFARRLMVILPFEEEFWRGHGVTCDYVGSPVLDHLKERSLEREDDLIGLLPGSRMSEVSRLWPLLVESAKLIADKREVRFIVPRAEGLPKDSFALPEDAGIDLEIIEGNSQEVMERSRLCIVASGTATLECAMIRTPMVAIYRFNPLTLFLIRRMVKISFMALPNLILGREAVPELLQADPAETAKKALELFDDTPERRELEEALFEVSEKMGKPGASMRAAEIVCDFLRSEGLMEA